jgi:hypothetical protein
MIFNKDDKTGKITPAEPATVITSAIGFPVIYNAVKDPEFKGGGQKAAITVKANDDGTVNLQVFHDGRSASVWRENVPHSGTVKGANSWEHIPAK